MSNWRHKMEILDIVDQAGIPVGKTIERNEAHRIGAWHRCASVWIVKRSAGKWQVLLQKRTLTKDSYPGCYDTSSAGHVDAGDAPLDTIIREFEDYIHASPRLHFCWYLLQLLHESSWCRLQEQ